MAMSRSFNMKRKTDSSSKFVNNFKLLNVAEHAGRPGYGQRDNWMCQTQPSSTILSPIRQSSEAMRAFTQSYAPSFEKPTPFSTMSQPQLEALARDSAQCRHLKQIIYKLVAELKEQTERT